MSEKFNSPSRVSSIMRTAKEISEAGQNPRVVEVWKSIFGLKDLDTLGTIFEVERKFRLLLEELDKCERLAEEAGVEQRRYKNSIGSMRSAITPGNLEINSEEILGNFNSSDVIVLEFIADDVPNEPSVEDESIQELSASIRGFKNHVSNLEDSTLRNFAWNQILNMEQAVSDYPIVGAKAFEQGMKDFAGEAVFNYDVWKENEDSETIEMMRELGGKLFNIVKYTAPFIQAGAGMKELLGL